jgi:diguanylate cyclase (GGDEF)-like protein
MIDGARRFSLPQWRLTRWLAHPAHDVPYEIYVSLVSTLFSTIPIFIGGVANSILVAAVIAARHPTWPFLSWLAFDIVVCLVRTYLIIKAYRAASEGRETPTDLYILFALLWALGIGAGTFISVMSGDWVTAALACLSSAAMMGGVCFRNFAAPRLATIMILLSFGPICLGGIASGEPIMLLTALQIPFYLYAMGKAAYTLNSMLVSSMRAERDSEFQARHDALTGLPNRRFLWEVGQAASSDAMVFAIVDIDHFKAVNDTFGHQAGDAVLRTVSRVMTSHLAEYGMVGRLGGEEFALIANRATVAQVLPALEALVRAMATTPIIVSGVTIHVTVSAGVAVRATFESFDAAYAAADMALYSAKRSGRNRIEVFGAEVPAGEPSATGSQS